MNANEPQPIGVKRTAALCFLASLLLCSYAIVRPASESLFLKAHGSEALMNVWILVAVVVCMVVPFFNRWSQPKDLVRVFSVTCFVCAGLLAVLLVLRDQEVFGAHYALYIWKDIY